MGVWPRIARPRIHETFLEHHFVSDYGTTTERERSRLADQLAGSWQDLYRKAITRARRK